MNNSRNQAWTSIQCTHSGFSARPAWPSGLHAYLWSGQPKIKTHCCSSLLPALHCLHEGCLKGEPAIHMLLQCTPLLVEKAGVAPDVTLSSLHVSKQKCRQENHPSFETHGKGHIESKIGAISGPTKWTYVQFPVIFQRQVRWMDTIIRMEIAQALTYHGTQIELLRNAQTVVVTSTIALVSTLLNLYTT